MAMSPIFGLEILDRRRRPLQRRTALAETNELHGPKRRVNLSENVNMVGKNFKFQDFASRLGGDLGDYGLESFGYLACQYLPGVLGAVDDVVLTRAGHVVAGLELLRHTALHHTSRDTAMKCETPTRSMERISCLRKGTEPYIPVAKARGLSALFW